MKRILPYNLGLATGRCWDIYRLAGLLTKEQYLPWYVEKFNDLYMPYWFDIYNYKPYSTSHISMYDEVLRYYRIDTCDDQRVINNIIEAINSESYVLSIMDEYYTSNNSNRKHAIHDILVLGYDDTKQELYMLNVGPNRQFWGVFTLQFNQYIASLYSGIKILKGQHVANQNTMLEVANSEITIEYYMHNLPLSTYTLKEFCREPDLARIYCSLDNYLKGGEYIVESHISGNLFNKERYGISIYRAYYIDLNNIIENINADILDDWENIPIQIKKIEDNKRGLIFRLSFLSENRLIPTSKDLELNLSLLSEQIHKAFSLTNKYRFSKDISVWRKACNIFKEIEKFDVEIINKCKKVLYQSIVS